MLALIRTLGPVAALLLGFLGGGGIIGAAGWAWNVMVDNPEIVRVTRAADQAQCTIDTQKAAMAATEAERVRQEKVAEQALDAYRAAADAAEQARQATADQLDKEIADHEQDMAQQGRGCTLTDDDFKWLRDQPGAPRPAAGGTPAGKG
jgi:hypothetical protein